MVPAPHDHRPIRVQYRERKYQRRCIRLVVLAPFNPGPGRALLPLIGYQDDLWISIDPGIGAALIDEQVEPEKPGRGARADPVKGDGLLLPAFEGERQGIGGMGGKAAVQAEKFRHCQLPSFEDCQVRER